MPTERMTVEDVLALPPVTDLTTAGRAWGIGATKSAELAKADEFPCPVLRLGRKYKVRKVDLLRSLGMDLDGAPLPPTPAQEVA